MLFSNTVIMRDAQDAASSSPDAYSKYGWQILRLPRICQILAHLLSSLFLVQHDCQMQSHETQNSSNSTDMLSYCDDVISAAQ